MILLIALIFSLALILPVSAADINDEIISADGITADDAISQGEEIDVELAAKDTIEIYGNTDTTLKVYAQDGNGEDVANETGIFINTLGKDCAENVKNSIETPYNNNPVLKVIAYENTFSALQEIINNASEGSTINLEHDYEYDSGFSAEGIFVNKTGLVINGNGHTLDAFNECRVFDIPGENVIIENLNIINGFYEGDGGALLSDNALTLRNMTFANNKADKGGAIYNENNEVYIENCIFTNNTARVGGSIWSFYTVMISDSSFMNAKAQYATAIFCSAHLIADNTTFENLTAEETAGAVAVKVFESASFNDCTFTNTVAKKNAGALFIDGSPGFFDFNSLDIDNCTFTNSKGDYGGALVVLHVTEANIENCEFTDNSAAISGGAIYISSTPMTIENTMISNNKIENEYDGNGGGLYLDYSIITITNCNISGNTKNGIYAYDTNLTIENGTISNNGEAIKGVFLDCNITNVEIVNDTVSLNGTDYINSIYEIANQIILITNTINVETLPSRYDSRDWGWVSSVKNQGDMGSCWTFGTCGALESALLKATGIEYDFSENNMQDSMIQYSKYGVIEAYEGGSREMGHQYILSWFGVFPTEYDSYDEVGKLSPLLISEDKIHIFDAMFVQSRANSTDNDALKRAILKCGSVTTGFEWDSDYYNEKTASYYFNIQDTTNHAISIVGWDDNYPASNFGITPPGNGAFIVKNSWGEDWGENGFFYISYYDTSLLNSTYAIGFIIENTENYTTNYQTDIDGRIQNSGNVSGMVSYKNTYQSISSELISAVGTYFDENENYTIEIYVNDELVLTQNGTAPFRGYHTVKLAEEIPVLGDDNFTAVMTKQSVVVLGESRQHYLENRTFINYGDGWKDLALENETISLKVYTKENHIYAEDLVKIYKNTSKFEAYVGDVGVNVTFELNGVNYTRVSDENGTASIAINLNPGEYSIKTIYGNYSVENSITVLPTLIADNLVKYFRNASQFYITLIDGQGNPVAGKNITMNINGVFYNRVTNENGTARLNINLNPGEYILTAIDPLTGLQMSYNITVLSILEAEDLEMKYKDGSTFNVTVLDGQGNPLAGVSVTFNINGVLYTRTSDSEGIARLNINLMAGKYIITSEYENLRISNTITIKD